MSHVAYSPVGYIYQADNYCLDCIPDVVGKKRNAGVQPGKCNCCECRLDRLAKHFKGGKTPLDRYDEHSFDSDDFPKAIPYHNDLHCECGPQGYGYTPADPEWDSQYCNAVCAVVTCHEVIDGVSKLDGPDVCPAYDLRQESGICS